MNLKYIFITIIILFFSSLSHGADNPDELYREGKYVEAEEIYSRMDMDHPKDVRYRYNRGCAAYQNSNMEGAAAAFSSVIRRSSDDTTRFRSMFNLGNIAFNQGDFKSASEYYKDALKINSMDEDARYNLELALRELQQKEKKEKEQEKQDQEKGEEGQKTGDDKSGQEQKRDERGEESSEKEKDGTEEQKPGEQDEGDAGKSREEREGDASRMREDKNEEDLSGELSPEEKMKPEDKFPEGQRPSADAIDRKKAEALLDNIKENRSGFLRFKVPEEKRRGVASGKNW
ncbi:MAG: tetratricopeptide repeat protein [Deltaproteobacteria bacterium]|nr:tetratricopeptide repeat protein [Deltaproteobacteria bacterium]